MLQVVMTANAFVVSFMAMPFNPTADAAALRVSCPCFPVCTQPNLHHTCLEIEPKCIDRTTLNLFCIPAIRNKQLNLAM